MKKFYGILFLLALMAFKTNVQAQVPCDAITTTVISPTQSGQYNYYGAKVSIAQGYGQNITVVGNLIDSENSAHTQQFTLTINAGELSVETYANVFQVGPTSGAEIEITSVTPCPTNENLERYKTFLNANSPNNNKPSKFIMGMYRSDYIYDISNTTIDNVYDTANNKHHIAYVTPISLDNEIIGHLFGIVAGLDQDRILNTEFVVSEMSQTITKVDVTLLKGEQLGFYTIEDNYVGTMVTTGGSTTSGIVLYARSWWGCTRECVSDVHIACHLDNSCSTMLWFTNLVSGFGRPRGAGAGSASIGVACGVYCAGNTNADLLPQY